jgi:hypothetical protein
MPRQRRRHPACNPESLPPSHHSPHRHRKRHLSRYNNGPETTPLTESRTTLPEQAPNTPPQQPPRNRALLFPWLLAACVFTVSIITAMATMVRGMTYARANQGALPDWYHPLLTISQCGLFLSTAVILILVFISFRRALKSK